MDNFVKEVVAKPEEDEAKTKFRKNMIRENRSIVDSIKDHLILCVSSLDTLKEMLESLTRLFEEKNINQNMTLGILLKNVKMKKSETIHSYFTRVS